jgi:hypothetical protein
MGNITIGGQVYTIKVVDAIKIEGEAVEVLIERQSMLITTTITDPVSLLLALVDEVGGWAPVRAVPLVGRVD